MVAVLTDKLKTRREKLLAAIDGPIDPVRTPAQYKLALLLAAFIMVLLPVVYVGLAFAFAFVVYYHAVNSVSIFEHVRGRGVIVALIIYVGPLIAGVTAVLFMFKPLFSLAAKSDQPTSLRRGDEPILFDFVDKLCDAVHAPRPKRIDVDCQVNASASFRRGWLSMLLGNDLVLTVGLPLITGMTLKQFGGILAHEFGHFAQGGGVRLSYVIRTVSHWFTRVVYERDTWDVNLERWSKEHDIRIGVIFYLARACVWLTRRVLWVLMMIGHGVSGLLLRQMEFDADRHEVRFSGSNEFEPTTRRLHELMVAHSMAFSDLSVAYQEGRLADDMVRLVKLNADDLPDEVEEYIDKQISEGQTGWLDTHPCDRERIASGLKENTDGVFSLNGPAQALFVDFKAVSKRASVNMYKASLEEKFHRDRLQPTEQIIAVREAQKKASESLDSFCQNGWMPLQAFPLGSESAAVEGFNKEASVAELSGLREQILKLAPGHEKTLTRINKADDDLNECARASLLLDSEFKVPADTFSRNLSSPSRIKRESDAINQEWSAAEADYRQFENVLQKRLWTAVSLLDDPAVQSTIANAADWAVERDTKLVPAFRAMMAAFPDMNRFRSDSQRFLTCLSLLENGNESEGLYRETRKSMEETRKQMRGLRESLKSQPYPFEHLEQDMTLGKFLCEKLPRSENPGEMYAATTTLIENYFQLYRRIMGRFCEMAIAVEEHFGLERFPVPKPMEEEEGAADGR